MALIINSKRGNDHVILSVKISIDEAKKLKDMLGNIHLVPEDELIIRSAIYERGKKGCTKYFLIPKLLRHDTKLCNDVYCTRIESGDKLIWAYFMDKFK